jgi:ComF family protein
VAAFSYSFPVSQLVKALKFHARLELANFLADELAQRMDSVPDAIVAMPLHPARLRVRGFNQSQLLAVRLARRLDVPLWTGVCHRVRDTPPQSSLPLKERGKNMRQAFAVTMDEKLRAKHIAIVDDVMTSAASMGELANALKKAGATTVTACVVARTLPHNHDS